jgi:hypothetical protein
MKILCEGCPVSFMEPLDQVNNCDSQPSNKQIITITGEGNLVKDNNSQVPKMTTIFNRLTV